MAILFLSLEIFFSISLLCNFNEIKNWEPKKPFEPFIVYYIGIIGFICSLVGIVTSISWEQKLDTMSQAEIAQFAIIVGLTTIFAIFYVTTLTSIQMERDGSMIVTLIGRYVDINHGAPKISYSLFKKMYALHSEQFELFDFSWYYHNERFSLNFFDYIRALNFISKESKYNKSKEMREKEHRLIKKMEQDLAKDAERIKQEKEKAIEETLNALQEQDEITQRILKEQNK